MIPNISLDDETFEKMMDRAKKQLPGLYPAWTDYNYHDPGITLLELFAWFTEMQRFHLDQTGERYLRKYRKLLGIRPRGISPAHAKVRICSQASQMWFPVGSRFYADEVCFETTEPRVVCAAEVRQLSFVKAGNSFDHAHRQTVTEQKLGFPAFGMQPEEGDTLWIGLDGALTVGEEHHLCVEVSMGIFAEHSMADTPHRNPFEEGFDFVPLAKYRLVYRSADGRQEAVIHSDTTYGLLQDGEMVISIDREMLAEEDGRFWMSLILTEAQYDLPPVLEHISIRELAVRQIHTLAELHEVRLGRECPPDAVPLCSRLAKEGEYLLLTESENGLRRYEGRVFCEERERGVCFRIPDFWDKNDDIPCVLIFYDASEKDKLLLGKGDETPFQTYQVRLSHLCREGLAILVETETGSRCYELWEECDDLDASGPYDRHFHFEEQTGEVVFGNGIHGRMPSGEILLASAHTSLGAAGNVKAGQICRVGETGILTEGIGQNAVAQNDREAIGGMDCETNEECRRRQWKRLREPNRAVTYEDFTCLAARTPGLAIERVKAIPASAWKDFEHTFREETVALVVKPYARESHPCLSEAYCRNIQRMLEPRRIIGTSIEILAPEYVGISVFVEFYSDMHSITAKECVDREMQKFFKDVRAEFGVVIHHSTLYGMLDVLDCVSGIQVLRMDAQGANVRRNQNGDILLPVNGLAYLKELTCIVSPDGEGAHER